MADRHEPPIELARPADWPAIEALLADVGLSSTGLDRHRETVLVARRGSEIVGSAALEVYADAALLRSVAVRPDLQRRGLGRRLVGAALELARTRGVETVALLTETAGPFFARLGFRPIARAAAPPALQATEQFRSACPASALCLVIHLSAADARAGDPPST